MSMDHHKWMQQAFKEAKKALIQDELPVGAVLVLGDEIIARGHNETKRSKNATRHAEIVCIERASSHLGDFRLNNAILYTTLEPCIMCSGALILSRVAKVVYACPDLRHGGAGSVINIFKIEHPIHQVLVEYFDMQEESAKMLKDFFKKRRLCDKG